jgi:hypothetical protein
MSGKVPPSSRALVRLRRAAPRMRNPSRSDIERGKDLYERFTGHDAEVVGKVEVPDTCEIGVVIGTLDALCYTTTRDGRTERYVHEFKAKDRPLFVVSPDGSQILIVGGNYDFTERGIVDGSDVKTRRELGFDNPRRRR